MIGAILGPVLWLVGAVIDLIIIVLIINAILSWLIAFDVVNRRNQIVDVAWTFTSRVTEPLLRPIRRFLPNLGGMDLSPLVLILGLLFFEQLLSSLAVNLVYRNGL